MTAPHLTPYVDAGPLVFLSGRIAFDEHGEVGGDITVQTQRCLERMERVLRDAGLTPSEVAKCTVWFASRHQLRRLQRRVCGVLRRTRASALHRGQRAGDYRGIGRDRGDCQPGRTGMNRVACRVFNQVCRRRWNDAAVERLVAA